MKRMLMILGVGVLSLGISGCAPIVSSSTAEDPDADVNEVFEEYYSGLTGAIEVTGDSGEYMWKAGREKFPEDQASWQYISAVPCDEEGLYKISTRLQLTHKPESRGIRDERIRRVQEYWESRGWEVSGAATADIIADLDYGTTITYFAGSEMDEFGARSKCYAGFGDESAEAEVFIGEAYK